jgi:acetyl esterase/lipase
MRHARIASSILLLLVIVTGAAAASGWRRNDSAAALPPGASVTRDLAYGRDPAQRLDVYRMPGGSARKPVIVMVHGGAWRFGDKNSPGVVENKVARWLPQGYVFVSIGYRMLPTLDALQQADEVALALAYVQSHAAQWGGDPGQLILMGHSAGAHLVALLSAAPEHAYALGARPWSATVALDSAALDVPSVMQRRHLPFYDAAFGADPARWRQASPVDVLDAKAIPVLAVCSEVRLDDSCDHARAYTRRAAQLGIAGATLPQVLKHGQINSELGLPGSYTTQVEKFMTASMSR